MFFLQRRNCLAVILHEGLPGGVAWRYFFLKKRASFELGRDGSCRNNIPAYIPAYRLQAILHPGLQVQGIKGIIGGSQIFGIIGPQAK